MWGLFEVDEIYNLSPIPCLQEMAYALPSEGNLGTQRRRRPRDKQHVPSSFNRA